MIKKYTLADGFTFETITIPKGTLLFRGIQFSELTPREHLTEFINRGSCIPPTKNVYFYPAPYAAITVNNFNVHILYTTNYNLELLLLVRPSTGFKPYAAEKNVQYERLITICNTISNVDRCGNKMPEDDPCFTNEFLDTFPHILGYIGLDAGDVDSFFGRYRAMIKSEMKNEISQLVLSLVSNSRNIIGIPEIVIHPLHLRRNNVARVKGDFNIPENQIKNIIANRARWNYTPLLYVSSSNIFSLHDMLNYKNIDKLKNAKFIDKLKGHPIFKSINTIMKGFSSKDGYTINGAIYHIKLDTRTGFYKVISPDKSHTRIQNLRESSIFEFTSNTNTVANTDIKETSILYRSSKLLPQNIIDDIKDNYLIDMNEDYVNKYLHSLLHFSVFERGEFVKKYKLEEIFRRSDLE